MARVMRALDGAQFLDFQHPLTPAGSRVLWMTRYDETLPGRPTRVNYENRRAAGWQAASDARLEAFQLNLINFDCRPGRRPAGCPCPATGLAVLWSDLRARPGRAGRAGCCSWC